MTTFPSIASFVAHLSRVAGTLEEAQRKGADEAGAALAAAAKATIGTEREGWSPLSPATMEGFVHPYGFRIPGKIELGFTGHVSGTDPLLRTGALRDSIKHQVTPRGLLLGSTSPIAPYQEYGTPAAKMPIPPRPFIGSTMFVHGREAAHHIAAHVVAALAGSRPPRALKF